MLTRAATAAISDYKQRSGNPTQSRSLQRNNNKSCENLVDAYASSQASAGAYGRNATTSQAAHDSMRSAAFLPYAGAGGALRRRLANKTEQTNGEPETAPAEITSRRLEGQKSRPTTPTTKPRGSDHYLTPQSSVVAELQAHQVAKREQQQQRPKTPEAASVPSLSVPRLTRPSREDPDPPQTSLDASRRASVGSISPRQLLQPHGSPVQPDPSYDEQAIPPQVMSLRHYEHSQSAATVQHKPPSPPPTAPPNSTAASFCNGHDSSRPTTQQSGRIGSAHQLSGGSNGGGRSGMRPPPAGIRLSRPSTSEGGTSSARRAYAPGGIGFVSSIHSRQPITAPRETRPTITAVRCLSPTKSSSTPGVQSVDVALGHAGIKGMEDLTVQAYPPRPKTVATITGAAWGGQMLRKQQLQQQQHQVIKDGLRDLQTPIGAFGDSPRLGASASSSSPQQQKVSRPLLTGGNAAATRSLSGNRWPSNAAASPKHSIGYKTVRPAKMMSGGASMASRGLTLGAALQIDGLAPARMTDEEIVFGARGPGLSQYTQ